MSDLSDLEIKEWEDTEDERQQRGVGGIACRDLMRSLAELRRHRAMVARLEAWAEQLATAHFADSDVLALSIIAAEIRNHMREPGHG